MDGLACLEALRLEAAFDVLEESERGMKCRHA